MWYQRVCLRVRQRQMTPYPLPKRRKPDRKCWSPRWDERNETKYKTVCLVALKMQHEGKIYISDSSCPLEDADAGWSETTRHYPGDDWTACSASLQYGSVVYHEEV